MNLRAELWALVDRWRAEQDPARHRSADQLADQLIASDTKRWNRQWKN